MLQVLAWWAVPVLVLVLGSAWVAWRGRARRPVRPQRSVARWRRSQEALGRATAGRHPAR